MKKSTAFVLIGVMSVALAVLVMVLVVRLASSPGGRIKLGNDVFDAGRASKLQAALDRGPLLFADPLRRGRDLVVERVNGHWVAYTGSERYCALSIDRKTLKVVDCHRRPVTYHPPTTPSYKATVDKNGNLRIDLRHEVGTTK